jgi:tetratricopeptide (TPR) repeat protein
VGWLSKKKKTAPTAERPGTESAPFLIPKDVDWTVEDISALEQAGDWEEALARWLRLLEPFQDPKIADQIAGLPSHRIIWQHVGACCLRLSRPDEAVGPLEKAESLAREAGDDETVLKILKDLGWARRIGGDADAALACLDKAIALASSQEFNPRLIGDLHDERSLCYGAQGEMKRALEEAHLACTLATGGPSSDASVETRLLTNLAISYIQMGRREEAVGLYEQALVKAREAGNAAQEAVIRENLAAARKGGG